MARSPALNEAMRRRSISAIQGAALAEFAEYGFHAATMARIAERAGVTKGLIYNYYATKDELLTALVAERLRGLAADAIEVAPEASARDVLRLRVDQAVARAVTDQEFYRIYFGLLLQPAMAPIIAAVEASLATELDAEATRLASAFAQVSEQPHTDLLLFQLALNGLALALLIRPELRELPEAFPLAVLQERLVELFLSRSDPRDPADPSARTARVEQTER